MNMTACVDKQGVNSRDVLRYLFNSYREKVQSNKLAESLIYAKRLVLAYRFVMPSDASFVSSLVEMYKEEGNKCLLNLLSVWTWYATEFGCGKDSNQLLYFILHYPLKRMKNLIHNCCRYLLDDFLSHVNEEKGQILTESFKDLLLIQSDRSIQDDNISLIVSRNDDEDDERRERLGFNIRVSSLSSSSSSSSSSLSLSSSSEDSSETTPGIPSDPLNPEDLRASPKYPKIMEHFKKLSKKRSLLTGGLFALFLHSCDFAKTEGEKHDVFDASKAVDAAVKVLGVTKEAVENIGLQMLNCGVLKVYPNGRPIPDSFSPGRFYFRQAVWPHIRYAPNVGFYPAIDNGKNPQSFESKDCKIKITLTAKEFARQLTLKEHEVMRRTKLVDLIDPPQACEVFTLSSNFCKWLDDVLSSSKKDEMIPFFFNVARECLSLFNFQGVAEIMTVFSNMRSDIYRVLGMDSSILAELFEISGLSDKGFSVYRKRLSEIQDKPQEIPPFIPNMFNVIERISVCRQLAPFYSSSSLSESSVISPQLSTLQVDSIVTVCGSTLHTVMLAKRKLYTLKFIPSVQSFFEFN